MSLVPISPHHKPNMEVVEPEHEETTTTDKARRGGGAAVAANWTVQERRFILSNWSQPPASQSWPPLLVSLQIFLKRSRCLDPAAWLLESLLVLLPST